MAGSLESLRKLVDHLPGCRTYPELRARLMDTVSSVVPARAWGVYRIDAKLRPADMTCRGVPDAFLLCYEELGRQADPVMAAVVDRHVALHNLQTKSLDEWHREPLYRHVTSRFGFEHILTAPLLGEGRIIGTLNFARYRQDRPFEADDVAFATAVSHHVSTFIGRLGEVTEAAPGLTPRELEVARLVAAGLNNIEIGRCLGISRNTVKETLKRIFRKVDVDSRAEMVARLTHAGLT